MDGRVAAPADVLATARRSSTHRRPDDAAPARLAPRRSGRHARVPPPARRADGARSPGRGARAGRPSRPHGARRGRGARGHRPRGRLPRAGLPLPGGLRGGAPALSRGDGRTEREGARGDRALPARDRPGVGAGDAPPRGRGHLPAPPRHHPAPGRGGPSPPGRRRGAVRARRGEGAAASWRGTPGWGLYQTSWARGAARYGDGGYRRGIELHWTRGHGAARAWITAWVLIDGWRRPAAWPVR